MASTVLYTAYLNFISYHTLPYDYFSQDSILYNQPFWFQLLTAYIDATCTQICPLWRPGTGCSYKTEGAGGTPYFLVFLSLRMENRCLRFCLLLLVLVLQEKNEIMESCYSMGSGNKNGLTYNVCMHNHIDILIT